MRQLYNWQRLVALHYSSSSLQSSSILKYPAAILHWYSNINVMEQASRRRSKKPCGSRGLRNTTQKSSVFAVVVVVDVVAKVFLRCYYEKSKCILP